MLFCMVENFDNVDEPFHAYGQKETLEDKCTNQSQNTCLSLNMNVLSSLN